MSNVITFLTKETVCSFKGESKVKYVFTEIQIIIRILKN